MELIVRWGFCVQYFYIITQYVKKTLIKNNSVFSHI